MERWTTESLKDYLDSHLVQLRAEITTRIGDLHREHDKFEEEVHDSMLKQNEFRGALSDLGLSMATRREMISLDQKLDDRLGKIEGWQSKIGGGLILIGVILPSILFIVAYFVSH